MAMLVITKGYHEKRISGNHPAGNRGNFFCPLTSMGLSRWAEPQME